MAKIESINKPFKYGTSMSTELKKDFGKIRVNNVALSHQEVEQKLTELLSWLITFPKHTCLRVNTQKTNVESVCHKVKELVEKDTGRIPIITLEPKIPEAVLVHSWNECVELDLAQCESEVIVDATCGEFVLKGAPVYAPGIIGIPHGLNVGNKVSVYADTRGGCLKGSLKYNDDSKVFLGNGILKQTRHTLFRSDINVSGIAVKIIDVISHLPQLNINDLKGDAIAQHLPCIICIHILNPQPGEIILDMCAAPGNKTTHISDYMGGKGTIIALDVNKRRIKAMEDKCKDCSTNNIKIYCCDAKKAYGVTDGSIEDGPPFNHNSFDRILLDPPCSGLGQRPQLFNKMTVPVLRSFSTLQQMLFKSAVRLLKPNGILVYSTCTTTVTENEEIVAWALKTFSCLNLISVRERFCIEKYGAAGYSVAGLTDEEASKVYRFGPESNSIGFFIACFRKLPE